MQSNIDILQYQHQSIGTYWWSVFIIIAAVLLIAGVSFALRHTHGIHNLLVSFGIDVGATALVVGTLFFFGQGLVMWWPLVLIVPCVTFMLRCFRPMDVEFSLGQLIRFCFYVGVSGVVLGSLFLLNNLGIVSLAMFGAFQWWSIPILFIGVMALFHALQIYRFYGQRITPIGQLLVGIGIYASADGLLAMLGYEWHISRWFVITMISIMSAIMIGFPARVSKQ